VGRLKVVKGLWGEFSERRICPMGKFLVNVLAAVAAGVIVALIVRFFNV
jgi:fluoride ion exporter CrcB/FEX